MRFRMKLLGTARLRAGVVLLSTLVMLVATSCGQGRGSVQSSSTTANPIGPVATPTVNILQARKTFEAGGELTFEEVVALKREIVGDIHELRKNKEFEQSYKSQKEYGDRLEEFTANLEKCTLRETIGWVTGSWQDYDENYKDMPDKNWLSIYVYNPFFGFGKDVHGAVDEELLPLLGAGYLTDNEIARFKYGQRISFRGQLTIVRGYFTVENIEYELLKDDPEVPEPTDDELSDLTVVLERSVCFGSCPDYSVMVQSDGRVVFEGRHFTKVKGKATANIDRAKLVEIANEIKKADFFSLDPFYSENVTDHPTYTLTVAMGGQRKQVESYATRPIRLEILMDRIDQILNTEQWIGSEKYP
jgi:hypothetical protein